MIKYILILMFAVQCQAAQYSATVLKCYDGDTFTCTVKLGLDVFKLEKVRINGIDSPEMNTMEGKDAAKFIQKLMQGKEVIIDTNHDDREKYGRLLCKVYLDGEDIGALLIKKGMAKEYHGEKRI